MVNSRRPVMVEATFNKALLTSSQKTPPPNISGRTLEPYTQVPRSPPTSVISLPRREGSPVKESLEIPRDFVPSHKLFEISPKEPSVVEEAFELPQEEDNEPHDLSSNGRASPNRIVTSQTRKSILTATDITTPGMAPKSAAARSSNSTKSAGRKPRGQPSQVVPPITNTGATSSLAALQSMRAGTYSKPNDTQQDTSNSRSQPSGKTGANPLSQSNRQIHILPHQKSTQNSHKAHKASQSEPTKRPPSRSQPNPSEPVLDEYDIASTPEQRQSKPLREPKSSNKKFPTNKQYTTKQATTKQPFVKHLAAEDPSPKPTASKRRGGRSSRTNVRIADTDAEADYSDAKTSRVDTEALSTRTRARTRAKGRDVPAGDSIIAQLPPATRSRDKQVAKSLRQNANDPPTSGDESYGHPEDGVTNLNRGGPAETVEVPVGESADPPGKKERSAVATQVEVEERKAQASKKLLDQSKAVDQELRASTQRPTSVLSIEDGDEDEDGDDDDDDDSASLGLGASDGKEVVREPSPQGKSSLHTAAAVWSSQPNRLRPGRTPAIEQDGLAKEHRERKSNLISFTENGPQNRGSLESRKTANPRLPTVVHLGDDQSSPGHATNGQMLDSGRSVQPTNGAAEILESMIGATTPVQDRPTHVQNHSAPPSEPASPIEEPRESEAAAPRPIVFAAPLISQAMVNPDHIKRLNVGDIRGPVKRQKPGDSKVRFYHSEALVVEQPGLRRWSQHTVNEDGSPVPREAHQSEETVPTVSVLHKPAVSELSPSHAVEKDASSFFPTPAMPARGEQQDASTGFDGVPIRVHEQKRQASPDMESQAISHVGLGEFMEDVVEQAKGPDSQEQPFANISGALMPEQRARIGLLDLLRSETEMEVTQGPEDARSEESQESTSYMDEDDADKTLVNDDSDDDSAGSSDTDMDPERHQAELSEWRKALKRHQGEVHDALVRVAHGFTRHLVEHETAIGDVIADFGRDGGNIIKQLEGQHEAELGQYSKTVLLARTNLVQGFKLTEQSLFEDLQEIKASSEAYTRTRQRRVDANERLDQLEAYFRRQDRD